MNRWGMERLTLREWINLFAGIAWWTLLIIFAWGIVATLLYVGWLIGVHQ